MNIGTTPQEMTRKSMSIEMKKIANFLALTVLNADSGDMIFQSRDAYTYGSTFSRLSPPCGQSTRFCNHFSMTVPHFASASPEGHQHFRYLKKVQPLAPIFMISKP